jgi:hypothetical protein
MQRIADHFARDRLEAERAALRARIAKLAK